MFVPGLPLITEAEYAANDATAGILVGSITFGFLFGSYLSGRMSLSHGLHRMILYGRGIGTLGLASSFMLLLLEYNDIRINLMAAPSLGVENGHATPSAMTAVMNVRSDLPGSASALSYSLIVFIGAQVTSIAGIMLQLNTTGLQLISLMFTITATGLGFAIWAAVKGQHNDAKEAASSN